MAYRLIRLTGCPPNRFVGEYPTYAEALAARGSDTFTELVANDGWWLRIEHVIVGPGLDGPATVHPFCTELGVDPHRTVGPTPDDLVDAHGWLTALHQS